MDAQAALAAFDRQNHAGASDALAANLRQGAQHPQPTGSVQHARDAHAAAYATWCAGRAVHKNLKNAVQPSRRALRSCWQKSASSAALSTSAATGKR